MIAHTTIAVILAAGQGSRLRPHTETIPKCLIRIGELPILHYQLAALQENGISNIILVVGYKADLVREYASRYFSKLSISFVYNPDYTDSDSFYSMVLALDAIPRSYAGSILQLNSDVLFDPQIIKQLITLDPHQSYTVVKYRASGPEDVKVVLASDGSVVRLSKRADPEMAVGEALGINKFSPIFFHATTKVLKEQKEIWKNKCFDHAIEHIAVSEVKLFPLDIGVLNAIEIDFNEDLREAQRIFSGASFVET